MRSEFTINNFSLRQKQEPCFCDRRFGLYGFGESAGNIGEHFINAGVAEQNMVTVAAALAHEGFIPWLYSISPFVTLRPYEQIRNDVTCIICR